MAPRNRSGDSFGVSRRGRGDRFDAPVRPTAAGIYPDRASGAGEYGGTAYPTILEAYNRNSDYRRWKEGQELHYGIGLNWSAPQILSIARLVSGPSSNELPLITTLFPSKTSPERSWHVIARVRGATILPEPITAERVRLVRADPDPGEHRLILDVTGMLNRTQLRAFELLVGDQFEDSAIGPNYPMDLMHTPFDAIALTLVGVDVGGRALTFDLSRPVGRVWRGGRLYWQPLEYDPDAPAVWRTAGDRHLTSSAVFDCSCPDYQGRSYGDSLSSEASSGDRFPRSSTGRPTATAWEQQAAGYFRQWRDLDRRRDRRRQCKHIHALRWEFGVPFDEPSDYPTGGEKGWVDSKARGLSASFEMVASFEGRRLLSYDRWLSGVARSLGFTMDPPGDLRTGEVTFRPTSRPVLWDDATEPKYAWCRLNDWWIQRSSGTVRAFSPIDGGFRELLQGRPVLEEVDAAAAGAPVIVP